MKRFRNGWFLLSMCLLLAICDTRAQNNVNAKQRAEKKARYFTKVMLDSLNVTAEQEEALYQMNIIVSEKFDSLGKVVNNLANQKERSHAYRSIYEYRDSCMRNILPIKEFLKFQDIEREKYERKKQQKKEVMANNKKGE